jgi:hypothetical protein
MKNMQQWVARSDEQWGLLARFMPKGWEAKARELGALRRTRGVKTPAALLRMLLLHLADGCSLRESATRITLAGWGKVSAVAVFKRLRASEHWLAWLAQASWNQEFPSPASRRFLAVDASSVREQGETGSLWRVHWCVDLGSLSCTHFELTDVHGGEKFARFPLRTGDVVMGDRGYSTPTGVESVKSRGGEVLVRLNPMALPLYDQKNGRRIEVLKRIRGLKVGQAAEWTAWVKGPSQWYKGRLLAVKRSRASALRELRRRRRAASRRDRRLGPLGRMMAHYVMIWTSVDAGEMPTREVFRAYRLRWQIELVFKRMKSIMGLGLLPKRTDGSSRAWLNGKLFVALLVEKLWRQAEHFSPWGYGDPTAAQPLA